MDTLPKTKFFNREEVEQKWYLVDAEGKTLGRMASFVARLLRGKNKPKFTPNQDVGDYVIVVNVEKVKLSGKRSELKKLYHNTGYPGGARFESVKELLKNNPEKVMEHAIKGMLPHNRLGRRIFKKLKVYRGDKHPHTAQQPEQISIK